MVIYRGFFLFLFAAVLIGCSDQFVSPDLDQSFDQTDAVSSRVESKLRNAHLVSHAQTRGDVAGKWGENGITHLFLAYNTLEADGVTRRVMDEWAVTRRILAEYGVTRRILDKYGLNQNVLEKHGVSRRILESYDITVAILAKNGVTRRVLSQYSGDITDAFLADFDVSEADLAGQGVSRRILDDYAVSRRVMDTYGLTPELLQKEMDIFVSSIKLKVRIKNGVPGISVKVKDDDFSSFIDEILSDPDILFVEPDTEFKGDPIAREESGRGNDQVIGWNIDQIGVMGTTYDSEGVDVYILDSGVFTHSLTGRGAPDVDLNVVERKDFTMLFQNREEELFDDDDFERLPYFDPGTSGNPVDMSGHGTHIAGIIGAIDNKDGVLGVAPGARLHSLKVLSDDGRTDVTTVVAAIDYVVHARMQNPSRPMVMNLSFGSDIGTTGNSVVDDAVERAIDAGIVVVVSAGNAGQNAQMYSPAHVERAITVGAFGQDRRFSAFSNHGDVVDLLAPGDAILSLSSDPLDYGKETVTVMESGTSMAAPHVSGAAALYLSLHPSAAPDEVRDALVAFAQSSILDSPSGTTTSGVYVGEFARDGSSDLAFSSTAEWSDGRGGPQLKLKGTGRVSGIVVYTDAETGAPITTVTVDETGEWDVRLTALSVPPCTVVATQYGESLTIPVTEGRDRSAVAGCTSGASIWVKKAEWIPSGRGEGFKLEIEGGTKDVELRVSYGQSGDILLTGTFNKDGKFRHTLKISDTSLVPCTVAIASEGATVLATVTDAPTECRQ